MTSMLGERNNKRIYKLQVGTHIHVLMYLCYIIPYSTQRHLYSCQDMS